MQIKGAATRRKEGPVLGLPQLSGGRRARRPQPPTQGDALCWRFRERKLVGSGGKGTAPGTPALPSARAATDVMTWRAVRRVLTKGLTLTVALDVQELQEVVASFPN